MTRKRNWETCQVLKLLGKLLERTERKGKKKLVREKKKVPKRAATDAQGGKGGDLRGNSSKGKRKIGQRKGKRKENIMEGLQNQQLTERTNSARTKSTGMILTKEKTKCEKNFEEWVGGDAGKRNSELAGNDADLRETT